MGAARRVRPCGQHPPAMAAITSSGSFPAATDSGSELSAESCEKSSWHAKSAKTAAASSCHGPGSSPAVPDSATPVRPAPRHSVTGSATSTVTSPLICASTRRWCGNSTRIMTAFEPPPRAPQAVAHDRLPAVPRPVKHIPDRLSYRNKHRRCPANRPTSHRAARSRSSFCCGRPFVIASHSLPPVRLRHTCSLPSSG